MSISVKTFKGVRVAVPPRASYDKAIEFLHLKKRWIQKHLTSMKFHETESRKLADLSAKIDRVSAKRHLIGRINWLATNHGFTFNRVTIRNQRTRWGSCSRSNNISLNIKLLLLPQELIDYVILHELVHTRISNHGKSFWSELDKYVGNGKRFAARLKKYDLGVV